MASSSPHLQDSCSPSEMEPSHSFPSHSHAPSPSPSPSLAGSNHDHDEQTALGVTPGGRHLRKSRRGRGNSKLHWISSSTMPPVIWALIATCALFSVASSASSAVALSKLGYLRGAQGGRDGGSRRLGDAYDADDDYVPPSEGALAAVNVTSTGIGAVAGTAATAAASATTTTKAAAVSAEATTATNAAAKQAPAAAAESPSQTTQATAEAATAAAGIAAEENSGNVVDPAGVTSSGAITKATGAAGSNTAPNNSTAVVAVPASAPVPENVIDAPNEISPKNDNPKGESIPAPLPPSSAQSAPSPATTVSSNAANSAASENEDDANTNESIDPAAPIVPAPGPGPTDSTEDEDDDYVPIDTVHNHANETTTETIQNDQNGTFTQQELDAEALMDEIDTIESEIETIEMETDDGSITDDAVYEAKQEEELEELEELEEKEEALIEEGLKEGLLEYVDDQYGAEYGYDDDEVETLDGEIKEIEEQIEELEMEDDDGAAYSVKEEEEEELKELEDELIEEEMAVLGLEREEDDYFSEEGLEDDDDVDGDVDDYNDNVANVDEDVVTIQTGGVNTTSGGDGNLNQQDGVPIIDPVITMDLTQYNKDANGTLSLVSNGTATAINIPAENAHDTASEQAKDPVDQSKGTEGQGTMDDDDDDEAAPQTNPSETEQNSVVGDEGDDSDGDDGDNAEIETKIAAATTEKEASTATTKPCQDDIYYRYEGDQTKDCNTFITSQEDSDKREKRCNKDSGIVDENTDVALLVGDFCKLSCGKCDTSDVNDSAEPIIGVGKGDAEEGGVLETPPSSTGGNVTELSTTSMNSSAGGGETNDSTTFVAEAPSVPSNVTESTENEGSLGQQQLPTGSNATGSANTTQPLPSKNIEEGGDTAATISPPAPVPEPAPQYTSSPSKAPITLEPTSTITSYPTRKPTEKPTYEYVETTDDDPVASEEEIIENEAFQNGEEVPHNEETSIPAASEGGAGGSGDESHESILEEEEEELKKVGGWMSFAAIVLMVFTAYQMSENPDGVCASLCRLAITVIGCIIKIILIPFKYVLGGGRPSGGHYMATPDYRDPYGSRHMELT